MNVATRDTATALFEQICVLELYVILIDLGNPSRDVLEPMFQVSRAVRHVGL